MTDTPTDLTAYAIAEACALATPDSPGSPGAAFLLAVQRGVREAIANPDDYSDDPYDATSEVATGAIPTSTMNKWRVFTDLALWRTDAATEAEGMSEGDVADVLHDVAVEAACVLWDRFVGVSA